MNTIKRIAENTIVNWLGKNKVVIITGARQVGKTTLLKNIFGHSKDVLWLNGDESSVRERLEVQSVSSLQGIVGSYKTVIIDEIQRIKNAGLLLKILFDNFKGVQFIATGSSALDIAETIFEPLTGRHVLFHLYPFSLAEVYEGRSDFEIEQELPFHLVFGNYPDIVNHRVDAETLLSNLTSQYLYKDVLVWKDIRKPELLDKLLRLLAFQVGSEVSFHELGRQLQVKSETVETYLNLLEKSFVLFRLKSYSSNHRKEVTKISKVYFWDNGIRNAILEDYDDWKIRNDKGQLLENFLISERLKMNAWTNPKVKSYFWRNYNQSEVDYLEVLKVEINAYEIKLAAKNNKVSAAFTNIYPDAQTNTITMQSFRKFCAIG